MDAIDIAVICVHMDSLNGEGIGGQYLPVGENASDIGGYL